MSFIFLLFFHSQLGLFVPNDGAINPTDLLQAYLKGAKKTGMFLNVSAIKYLNNTLQASCSSLTFVLLGLICFLLISMKSS